MNVASDFHEQLTNFIEHYASLGMTVHASDVVDALVLLPNVRFSAFTVNENFSA